MKILFFLIRNPAFKTQIKLIEAGGEICRKEYQGQSLSGKRIPEQEKETGKIRKEAVSEEFDVGAVKVVVESAFLSELDGEGILERLREKVEKGELLDDCEQMEFIILPLSYRRQEEKEEKIREAVDLAIKIQDRDQQLFVLAGILTFTDKIIEEESAKIIRRAIQMTKVAMIFEKEKEEAVREERQRGQQAVTEEKQKRQQVIRDFMEEKRGSALKMIADGGISLEKIAEYAGLDIKVVTELARGVKADQR